MADFKSTLTGYKTKNRLKHAFHAVKILFFIDFADRTGLSNPSKHLPLKGFIVFKSLLIELITYPIRLYHFDNKRGKALYKFTELLSKMIQLRPAFAFCLNL